MNKDNKTRYCKCGCGKKVKSNRYFYSWRCRTTYEWHIDWSRIRKRVIHKNGGYQCRVCGIDVNRFKKDFNELQYILSPENYEQLKRCLNNEGWPVYNRTRKDWVDIHHIRSIHEVGSENITDLLVLCVPCHLEIHGCINNKKENNR